MNTDMPQDPMTYHREQELAFDRLQMALSLIADLPKDTPWHEAQRIAIERYNAQTATVLGTPCSGCGLPRLISTDDEHGTVEICTNPECPYDM